MAVKQGHGTPNANTSRRPPRRTSIYDPKTSLDSSDGVPDFSNW